MAKITTIIATIIAIIYHGELLGKGCIEIIIEIISVTITGQITDE
jgi:hypothetical protein